MDVYTDKKEDWTHSRSKLPYKATVAGYLSDKTYDQYTKKYIKLLI